jgi:hypothetical protein
MMNKEQIIDEAYENYSKEYEKDNSIGMCLLVARMDGKSTYRKPNKEMFVDLCTHDKTFSQKWGLKIEERELSRKERGDYYYKHGNIEGIVEGSLDRPIWENGETAHKWYDERNVPTKLITITYNNETLESYE